MKENFNLELNTILECPTGQQDLLISTWQQVSLAELTWPASLLVWPATGQACSFSNYLKSFIIIMLFCLHVFIIINDIDKENKNRALEAGINFKILFLK